MAGGNKRTQAKMRTRGMRYRRQPRRVMHTRRILWLHRGREIVRKKEEAKKGRNDGGPDEDAASVRGGQYLREGWVLRVSATERNCTGWGTLIYWVITDLGAKTRRIRGVWGFRRTRLRESCETLAKWRRSIHCI